jgi:hypothetical protein
MSPAVTQDVDSKVAASTQAILLALPEAIRRAMQGGAAEGRKPACVGSPIQQKVWDSEAAAALQMAEQISSPVAASIEQVVRESFVTEQREDSPGVTRKVTLRSYIRTIWAVLWTTFRHPFTTTVIDPYTGKVLRT